MTLIKKFKTKKDKVGYRKKYVWLCKYVFENKKGKCCYFSYRFLVDFVVDVDVNISA